MTWTPWTGGAVTYLGVTLNGKIPVGHTSEQSVRQVPGTTWVLEA